MNDIQKGLHRFCVELVQRMNDEVDEGHMTRKQAQESMSWLRAWVEQCLHPTMQKLREEIPREAMPDGTVPVATAYTAYLAGYLQACRHRNEQDRDIKLSN